jgi:hypothetical protein
MAFKYRERSQEAAQKRSEGGGDFKGFILDEFKTYSPKKGENEIRILPPTWDGAAHYGMDIFVHYGIGPDRASVLCNYKMFGEKCKICEERMQAEKDGDEQLKKDLRIVKRVLMWLIDRKNEDAGVLAYAAPWTLDKDFVKASKDRTTGKYLPIDHPDEGYDIYFDKSGEKDRTEYDGVGTAKRPSSVATKFLDYIEEHPLDTILQRRSYDDVVALYEGAAAVGGDTRTKDREASDRGSARSRNDDDDGARDRSRNDDPPPRDRGRNDDDAPSDRNRDSGGRDRGGGAAEEPDRSRERGRKDEPEPERRTIRERTPSDESASGSERASSVRERFAQRNRDRTRDDT